MGDNSSAFKTIGILILLLIGLAAAAIFSYNPFPNIKTEVGTQTEATNTADLNPTCDSDDQSEKNSCCSAWATENEIETPLCEGNWSWTQLGGCTYSCNMDN